MNLYAVRPLLVDEDRGRCTLGQPLAYHCASPIYALYLAWREIDGGSAFDAATGKELRMADYANDFHVRQREDWLKATDCPF